MMMKFNVLLNVFGIIYLKLPVLFLFIKMNIFGISER